MRRGCQTVRASQRLKTPPCPANPNSYLSARSPPNIAALARSPPGVAGCVATREICEPSPGRLVDLFASSAATSSGISVADRGPPKPTPGGNNGPIRCGRGADARAARLLAPSRGGCGMPRAIASIDQRNLDRVGRDGSVGVPHDSLALRSPPASEASRIQVHRSSPPMATPSRLAGATATPNRSNQVPAHHRSRHPQGVSTHE